MCHIKLTRRQKRKSLKNIRRMVRRCCSSETVSMIALCSLNRISAVPLILPLILRFQQLASFWLRTTWSTYSRQLWSLTSRFRGSRSTLSLHFCTISVWSRLQWVSFTPLTASDWIQCSLPSQWPWVRSQLWRAALFWSVTILNRKSKLSVITLSPLNLHQILLVDWRQI